MSSYVGQLLSKMYIFILLFLMIFSPTENMQIKIIMLLFIAGIGFINLLKRTSPHTICLSVLCWFGLFIFCGVFFTMTSILNENSNPTNFINIYVIEPIMYLCVISLITPRNFSYINKSIIIILILVLSYNLVYALSLNQILPQEFAKYLPYIKENLGGITLGFIKITAENISWLLYLIPYFIAAYLIKDSSYNSALVFIIILGGGISMILTIRTAFILGILITPFIVAVGSILTGIRFNKDHILIAVSMVLLAVVFISFLKTNELMKVFEDIAGSFSSKDMVNEYGIKDNGGSIRYEQLKDLLSTWIYKPLIGWGDSASALHVIRSDSAGSYELTYVAMLMQRGVLGVSIFLAQIIWIYAKGIKVIRHSDKLRPLMFCTLVGYTVFLLANATNPYVYSFDRLLILFFPLILINQYEVYEKNVGLQHSK